MRSSTLPKSALLCLALGAFFLACGRKGDPVPRPRVAALPCHAAWASLRVLRVTLPSAGVDGGRLRGVEKLWVYYLPLGASRPGPGEVVARGEVILECRRPNLPGPGEAVNLDLSRVAREPGWVVAVAVRVGDVVGQPSATLPWLAPELGR